VETFEGQRIPGAAYSWSAPAGTTLPQDPAKPYLTATNKVGKYKVTVAFTGNTQTCQLETDISATPCQTFTDGSCTDTKTPITNTTPPVNINNLGVGDVFQAGDYDVTVTNISAGSQGNGWTGTGLVNQNLIGQIQMPLTVEFQNIKVNECYQYFDRGINGAVVQTKVDETWSSVVSVDEIKNLLINTFAEIEDILANFPDDKAQLQQKAETLRAIKQRMQNGQFTNEYKAEVLASIGNVETAILCKIAETNTNPSARVVVSTTTCDVTGAMNQAKNTIQNSQTIPYLADVFDENGNYLANESKPNAKFVVIKLPTLSYVLLNEYYVLPTKTNVINNIFMHYWLGLGFSAGALKDGKFTIKKREDEKGDLSTSCTSNQIYIFLEQKSNSVGSGLHQIAYLKSALYHEKFHLIERLACPVENSYKSIDEHIEVYYKQFSKPDFKTTMELGWINGLYITLVDSYITPLGKTYPSRAIYWKNKFKALNLGI
jgi:hypothetical protein